MVQKLFNLDKGLQKVEQRRFNAQYYDKESEDYDLDSLLSGSAVEMVSSVTILTTSMIIYSGTFH